MLSANNYPYSVLLPTGAVLAKDLTVSDLTLGQIGVFNTDTGKSLDTSNLTGVERFYLAVGIDTNGDGTVDNIMKSSGQAIQRVNISNYNGSCYQAAVPQIIQVSNLKAKCDTEYILGIEFRSQTLTRWYNQNFPRMMYSVRTSCCADCADCSDVGSGNELANLTVNAINADKSAMASAVLWDTTNNAVITNLATWITANPTLTASIRITSIPEKLLALGYGLLQGVNDYPNGLMTMTAFFKEGFGCGATITEPQSGKFELQSGAEVRQLEDIAKGFTEFFVYRVTESGTPLNSIFGNTLRATAAKYHLVTLDYIDRHEGGLAEFGDKCQTIIAIPFGGNTSVLTVLDAITNKSVKAVIDACV